MTQKIIKVGSSVALVIPKEVSKKNNLLPGREMDFKLSKKGELVYKPHRAVEANFLNKKQEKVAEIAMNFINHYRRDLEALKDK